MGPRGCGSSLMLPGSPGWQLHPARGWARGGDRPAEGTGTTLLPAGRSAPVLGGHRRLLKLSRPIPTSPGCCECQAWRGLGTASLPAPGAIFGADPLSWVQTRRSREGRAGTGTVLFPGMTQELPTPENWGEAQRGATGAGEEEEEGMAPGTPCPPHGRGSALLLVPYDEVEEVFVDVGFPGEQGAAQLLAAVAEGAGQVEIFVAAKGAEGAVSRGGGALPGVGEPAPRGSPRHGANPIATGVGGWMCCPSAPSPSWAWEGGWAGEGAQSREPPSPSPYATAHTVTRGAAGGALPCGRCRATIRGGLRGAGGQGMPAFPRLPALFGASHQGEYIKDRTKARGPRRGGCCRRRCLARPPHGGLLPPARTPTVPPRGAESGYRHRGT